MTRRTSLRRLRHRRTRRLQLLVGGLALREDQEPQIVVNRARPISDYANGAPPEPQTGEQARREPPRGGTLYLRLPTENTPLYRKVKAILNMFPGQSSVVLYFEDTRQRRGTRCVILESMLTELKNILGEGNVVLK